MNKTQLITFAETLVSLKEKLKCPICLDVIKEVVELDCGHKYCEECYSEHKSIAKVTSCPLCKKVLKRRASVYKDAYASSLGNFVTKFCREIYSLYNCQVEQIPAKLRNNEEFPLKENDINNDETNILPSTSKMNKKVKIRKSDSSKENCEDAFDRLMNAGRAPLASNKGNIRRVYANKKKLQKKPDIEYNILQFDNYENKAAVLRWLNDTRNKFDRLTQTQNLCSEEEHKSPTNTDIISISQVKENRNDVRPFVNKYIHRGRAKSLDVKIKKMTPKEKKRYSDGGRSDIVENYNIEEVNTEEEEVVKKVEEKVLLDLIEDEFLDKLESEMQNKPKPEEKSEGTERAMKITSQTSTTGWDRILKINKTIKKGKKVPKQLNITLQSTQNAKDENKEVKKVNLQSVEVIDALTSNLPTNQILNPDKQSQRVDTEAHSEMVTELKTKNEKEKTPSYDLHKLEEYITKNIIFIDKNTSLTSTSVVSLSEKNISANAGQIGTQEKDNEAVKKIDSVNMLGDVSPSKVLNKKIQKTPEDKEQHRNEDDDIIFNALLDVATQVCSNDCIRSNQKKENNDAVLSNNDDLGDLYSCSTQKINHICKEVVLTDLDEKNSSVPELFDLLENIVEKCEKNLKSNNTYLLQNQFLSVKSYVSKLKSLSCKLPVEPEREPLTTCDAVTQIDTETVDKIIQTEVNTNTIETQTDDVHCSKCNIESGGHTTRLVSQNTKNAIASMLSEPEINLGSIQQCIESNKPKCTTLSKSSQFEPFTATLDNLNFDTQDIRKNQGIILRTPKEQIDNIQLEEHRKRKGGSGQETHLSSGSILVCTLEAASNPIGSKNSQKEICEANASKRFKRIRTPSSSSTDSEVNIPVKKPCNRFIKDDLTVEFETNTQTGIIDKVVKSSVLESEDSKNENYDEYLAQVMQKYDSNGFVATVNTQQSTVKDPEKEIIKDVIIKCEDIIDQASKNIRSNKKISQTSSSSKANIQTTSQNINNFNEALTADKVFMDEHNLQKIENAIEDYEKGSNKAQSSECSDIIVDTEELEPLPKRPRKSVLLSSNNNPKTTSSLKNYKAIDDLDKICSELNDSFDEGLENIEICEEQGTNQKVKVNVISDVKVKSQRQPEKKEDEDLFSDEDIVESTPQKKKCSFVQRSILSQIDNIDSLLNNNLPNTLTEVEHFDYNLDALPPPPDFQDDVQEISSDSDEEPRVASLAAATNLNNLSLTPDKLSQFSASKKANKDFDTTQVLSPCILLYNKENQNGQDELVIPEERSQLNVNGDKKQISHSTPITQRHLTRETLGFSPILVEKDGQSGIIDMINAIKNTPLSSVARNSSQKQNILASIPKQKSIWNYIKSSQSGDETRSVAKTKPCIACTRLSKEQIKSISQLTNKKLATYSSSFNPNITHMIVAVNEKNCIKDYTIKFVSAVAAGLWVLRFEWIEECLSKNCIVPEEPFEALDTSGLPGPKISRLTSKVDPLFKGYKFYCADPFISINRKELEDIINMLGGRVLSELKELLENDGNVALIIGEGHVTQDFEHYERWAELYKTVTVDIEWLSKCIGQYKLISFRPYVWCAEENLDDFGYPSYLTETVPFSFTETN